ncbi:predicted GPI-anchored protein 58 [Chiroxiphia lanceolata]|uniref:predicted GPI-anchored protein 58 n=1 Tax=Chiroxiphia lanceolata TaxID=296741 RepID=UPI0013CECECB|nr:predicted GPI-anchored protein 58 [Chiroxiphia lanceolata]
MNPRKAAAPALRHREHGPTTAPSRSLLPASRCPAAHSGPRSSEPPVPRAAPLPSPIPVPHSPTAGAAPRSRGRSPIPGPRSPPAAAAPAAQHDRILAPNAPAVRGGA